VTVVDPADITASLIAYSEVTPGTTVAIVDVFGWWMLGGLLAYLLLMRVLDGRRAAAAERAQSHADAPLAPGAAVIAGRVVDTGDGPAVTVCIHQDGYEHRGKGGYYHHWKERWRDVTARPFHVARASGELVRVEPDERVFLVDRLDGIVDEDDGGGTRRARTATLTAGEQVYVTGTLAWGTDPQQSGGYRGAGRALVMKPPARGRMLISTEPLIKRHRDAARDHGNLALFTAVVLLLAHGGYFLRYDVLRLFGHPVNAVVTERRAWDVWHTPKHGVGHWVHHYGVAARDPATDAQFSQECSAYYFYRASEGDTVPFLVAGPFSQLGLVPTQGPGKLVVFALLALPYTLIIVFILLGMRPWWERRRVVDTGDGRLAMDTVGSVVIQIKR
jgi:hypothetical protein